MDQLIVLVADSMMKWAAPAGRPSSVRTTTRLSWVGAVLAPFLLAGCCMPLVRSDRLAASVHSKDGAANCEPLIPDGIYAACQPALRYIAGPFMLQDTAGQAASADRAPHSKFHPVPTRPVFGSGELVFHFPSDVYASPLEPTRPLAEPPLHLIVPEPDTGRPNLLTPLQAAPTPDASD